jgi:hypothetical protein
MHVAHSHANNMQRVCDGYLVHAVENVKVPASSEALVEHFGDSVALGNAVEGVTSLSGKAPVRKRRSKPGYACLCFNVEKHMNQDMHIFV